MKTILEKIKYAPHGLFAVLSGSPRGYWGKFIFFVFLFLMLIFLFDVSLYFDAAYTIVPDEPLNGGMTGDMVNERALDFVLSTVSQKEEALDSILQLPITADPSR